MQNPDWIVRAKSIMHDKKISQADLMPILGIKTRGGVGHYFTKRTQPTLEQFRSMANYFEVSLDFLLSGDGGDTGVNSKKLQDCILAVSNVIEENNIELTAPQQAKLITHVYADTPNNKEVSEKKIYDLISIFK